MGRWGGDLTGPISKICGPTRNLSKNEGREARPGPVSDPRDREFCGSGSEGRIRSCISRVETRFAVFSSLAARLPLFIYFPPSTIVVSLCPRSPAPPSAPVRPSRSVTDSLTGWKQKEQLVWAEMRARRIAEMDGEREGASEAQDEEGVAEKRRRARAPSLGSVDGEGARRRAAAGSTEDARTGRGSRDRGWNREGGNQGKRRRKERRNKSSRDAAQSEQTDPTAVLEKDGKKPSLRGNAEGNTREGRRRRGDRPNEEGTPGM